MSAPAIELRPPSLDPRHTLVHRAEALADSGKVAEAEALLRSCITESPAFGEAYRALALVLANGGRDIDAFQLCAEMLTRAPGAESYVRAAEVLLFLHLRHASLITRQDEPVRLDFRAIGVENVAPMVLAPTFLGRALQLSRIASAELPTSALAHATQAECELRAGFPRAARKAAQRAIECERSVAAVVAGAFAAFADHRERDAITTLRSAPMSTYAPSLGSGELLTLRVDRAFAPTAVATDRARSAWAIPYEVQHAGSSYARTVTVRTGAPEMRTIRRGRVVGGLCIPLDDTCRAFVHGVVDEPDVAFATPRFHDLPAQLAPRRNTILTAADDRLLLHSPGTPRTIEGRAFLLNSNFGSNYYHWIADVLGRLAVNPAVIDDPDMRFVVGSPLQPFQVETLQWMGIELDRLIQVGDDEIASFDELLVVHHRKDGGCTDAGVWRWLRERLGGSSLTTTQKRRLYLRRSGSVMRRLLNEERAAEICQEHGFESIDTATMTVDAQRKLFAEASTIVSPVGASLTNLLFAPAGAQLVLFGQRGYVVPCYNALAEAMGQSVCYVLGTEQQSRFPYPHWDYTIEDEELRAALSRALEREQA